MSVSGDYRQHTANKIPNKTGLSRIVGDPAVATRGLAGHPPCGRQREEQSPASTVPSTSHGGLDHLAVAALFITVHHTHRRVHIHVPVSPGSCQPLATSLVPRLLATGALCPRPGDFRTELPKQPDSPWNPHPAVHSATTGGCLHLSEPSFSQLCHRGKLRPRRSLAGTEHGMICMNIKSIPAALGAGVRRVSGSPQNLTVRTSRCRRSMPTCCGTVQDTWPRKLTGFPESCMDAHYVAC